MKRISEGKLSCVLMNDPLVNEFLRDIVFLLLEYVTTYLTEDEVVEIMKERTIGNHVVKPGFNEAFCRKLLSFVRQTDKISFVNALQPCSFKRISGSMYSFFYNANLYEKILQKNKKIQIIFKRKLNKMFGIPLTVSTETLLYFIRSEKNKDIIKDIIQFSSSNTSSASSGIHNMDYIRTKIPRNNEKTIQPTGCNRTMVHPMMKIFTGDSTYKIDTNSFFHNIMTYYKRPYIAGPSGSAVATKNFFFDIMEIEKSPRNQLLLLSVIIAEYIPYYHSLTEILMTYTLDEDYPYTPYTLYQDPIRYYLGTMKAFV